MPKTVKTLIQNYAATISQGVQNRSSRPLLEMNSTRSRRTWKGKTFLFVNAPATGLEAGTHRPGGTPRLAVALRGPRWRTHPTARPQRPPFGRGPAPSPAPAPASSGPRAPLSGPPPGVPPRSSHSRARTPARAAARSWGSRASLPVSQTSAGRPFPRAQSGGGGGGGHGKGPEVGPAGWERRTKEPGGGWSGRRTDGRTDEQTGHGTRGRSSGAAGPGVPPPGPGGRAGRIRGGGGGGP